MQTIKISINQTPGHVAFRIDGGAILAIIQRDDKNIHVDTIFHHENGKPIKECNFPYSADLYFFVFKSVWKLINNKLNEYGLNVEFVNLQAAEIVNP